MENYKRWHRLAARLFFPAASKILVQTKEAKQDLVRLGIPKEKIYVHKNWVGLISLNRPKRKFQRKTDVLFCGRFSKQKNLQVLLSVIQSLRKKHPNIQARLIGDGPDELPLLLFIEKYHLEKNVTVSRPLLDVSKAMQQAKLFVLTSLFEGQPMVLFEAMYFGAVPVVLAFPGVSEYIRHQENGFICKNTKEMQHYISLLMTNHKLRNKIAKNAAISVKKHFSEENIMTQLELLELTK